MGKIWQWQTLTRRTWDLGTGVVAETLLNVLSFRLIARVVCTTDLLAVPKKDSRGSSLQSISSRILLDVVSCRLAELSAFSQF